MSNKIWKKSLTVQLIFLVIISRFFCSTFNSFYLPAPIVVFDHMCLLLGSFFCITETEATHKKEEEEKMCEWFFHLNNCWHCQKCPVSYSVLTAILLNHAFVYDTKWYVSRVVGCLAWVRGKEGKRGKKRTQRGPKEDTSSFSPNPGRRKKEFEEVCERLFHLNNCLFWQKCPVSLSILFKLGKG